MSDGKGCQCNAHCEHECCCDADWTPKEVYDLRAEVAKATAERDALAAEVAALTTANASLAGDAVGLRIACAAIKAERDEARREACELLARSMRGPMEIATERGWDCFEEGGDA
jgi:hypothetical protein